MRYDRDAESPGDKGRSQQPFRRDAVDQSSEQVLPEDEGHRAAREDETNLCRRKSAGCRVQRQERGVDAKDRDVAQRERPHAGDRRRRSQEGPVGGQRIANAGVAERPHRDDQTPASAPKLPDEGPGRPLHH